MLRGLLAAVAALVLVGVLSALIVESRTVNPDYYAAHADRIRAIESSRNDITDIIQSTLDAFQNGRAVSAATGNALTRLVATNSLLQQTGETRRESASVNTQLAAYDASLNRFISSGRDFMAEQNEYADALRTLQEESPLVVKDLRRFKLDYQAQITFSLAIDVIEYATGASSENGDALAARIDELQDDTTANTQAPGILDSFVTAARTVIDQRIAAELALQSITESRILDTLWTLSNEIVDDNNRTVNRAERARLLLSVCTFLLLLGVGYSMFRLQASYRDLNKSNRELESVNNSLEERVSDRTQELSTAYVELKESQVQLVQAEKMSSLGELVAGISHEINTPLWYLISNSTVLQERIGAFSEFVGLADGMLESIKRGSDVRDAIRQGLADMKQLLDDGMKDDIDEAKDLVSDSIEGLEELTELAQSLKDFSRLDRARFDEFNVNDGLDKTLLIAKNKLKNKATIHKHYGDVPQVRCSPSQINQVFLNLLTNAADAIEESGEIVIRTVAENESVSVSISDTGCGISEENLARIRDPFFTTKEVGKGTGLGLSIVDRIVTSHGGDLSIESKEGKGTTVTIVLPLVAAEPAEESGEAAESSPDQVASVPAANDPVADKEATADDSPDGLPEVATV